MKSIRSLLALESSPAAMPGRPWWWRPVLLRPIALFVLIVWGGYFSYSHLRDQVMVDASESANESIQEVEVTLNLSNEFYLKQCRTAMSTLRRETLALGAPRLEGTVTVGSVTVPNLAFGPALMGNNFTVVDDIKAMMGGTSTLFVRNGNGFVRITTNVQNPAGQRAIGTVLNPKGAAIGPLLEGKSFAGVVDILGNSFITEYDPIVDAGGNVIGAWYVGYPIETLTDLTNRIAAMHILDHGFVSLLDNHHGIVAHSANTETSVIQDALAGLGQAAFSGDTATMEVSTGKSSNRFLHAWQDITLSSGWRVQKADYAPWGYTILAATYVPDVFWRSFKAVWIGCLVMGFLGLGALVAQGSALARARELKATAEAARSAAEEASQTKSAFLANMSHELRTPLNAIIGYSEMLIEDSTEATEEIVPDLEKIQAAGKHLLSLINDILDLSKIEAGKMTLYLEDFDVAHLIQDVASTIRPLLEKNGNALEIDARADDLGQMHGDVTKTRQVLFNLLSNASKFTQDGKVQLAVERQGARVTFRITDTGIGMTPEQMGRLFREFSQADDSTTRKFGGTGLGLAICKRFCELMGGTIEVSSTPGIGSTFTVVLPAKVAALAETPSKPATTAKAPVTSPANPISPGTNSPPCILVVDDDPAAQDLMKRILEKERYQVVIASSGRQALEMCAAIKPRLITLDVMMPDMDGWAILKQLKSDPATADIPVVMVTMLDDKPLGFALGASDYVTKPFDRDSVLGILQRGGIKSPTARVLVVDDDPDVYQLAAKALEQDGFKTAYAPNGRIALDMIADSKPDLIVLDLKMPEMNGIDFMAELHRREGDHPTPIVIFSAKDLTESEAQLLRLSTRETLLKSGGNTLDLVAAVKRVLS